MEDQLKTKALNYLEAFHTRELTQEELAVISEWFPSDLKAFSVFCYMGRESRIGATNAKQAVISTKNLYGLHPLIKEKFVQAIEFLPVVKIGSVEDVDKDWTPERERQNAK